MHNFVGFVFLFNLSGKSKWVFGILRFCAVLVEMRLDYAATTSIFLNFQVFMLLGNNFQL